MTAGLVALAGVVWWNLFHPSLIAQALLDLSPTARQDQAVESGLLPDIAPGCFGSPLRRSGHVPDFEILQHHNTISVGDLPGDFMRLLDAGLVDLPRRLAHPLSREAVARGWRTPGLATASIATCHYPLIAVLSGFISGGIRRAKDLAAGQGHLADVEINADDGG